MSSRWPIVALPIGLFAAAVLVNCGSPDAPVSAPSTDGAAKPAAAAPMPEGPLPALLMVQAFFTQEGGRPKPGPAKLVIWRTDGERWFDETLLDPDSNVFHKAVPWRDGILTIGAMKAQLKHWKRSDDGWQATTLWERSWGGKFDRLRDVEVGDVTGDGIDDLVLATHDQGVVAVGIGQIDGGFNFVEMDQKADTFVHEVEIGDVDGDGVVEFYVTPSDRNRASGESQPGGVARYAWDGTSFKRTQVVHWAESHAKEILVADVDGDGKPELYAVREAHAEKQPNGTLKRLDPVRIAQMVPGPNGTFTERVVATLDDDQCRFLLAADVDHDGKVDLIAAGKDSGLWWMRLQPDGTFTPTLIDANSGGFEHATHAADLDGDGKVEIYVAADKQGELRRYLWNGSSFDKRVISAIPDKHITWNLQDAKL